jgi:predicted AAA+ superfamily ATPase
MMHQDNLWINCISYLQSAPIGYDAFMIQRHLSPFLLQLADRCPLLAVTGPRAAGKEPLVRAAFPDLPVRSLRAPDLLAYAREDPRGLLDEHRDGAVILEAQRAPALLETLQAVAPRLAPGSRFVLTASRADRRLSGMARALAGGMALVSLLPCSLDELGGGIPPGGIFEAVWRGGFPGLAGPGVDREAWFQSHIADLIERDVPEVLRVADPAALLCFLRLCAGSAGEILNLSRLGGDCGVTHNTARAWLEVLESLFVLHRLRPFLTGGRQREIRTPRVHFRDTGLACALLGIRAPGELRHHPLRGALFADWAVAEIVKWRVHRGLPPRTFFYRDRKGFQVDLVLHRGEAQTAVLIRSAQTAPRSFLRPLRTFAGRLDEEGARGLARVLVYGGDEIERRDDVLLLPWHKIHTQWWQ